MKKEKNNKSEEKVGNYRIVQIREEIDELLILITLGLLKLKEYRYLDHPKAKIVIDAIKRSKADFNDETNLDEISEYIKTIPDTSMESFLNNILGIANEIHFVDSENNDGDEITAELAEDTNNPGWDVKLSNNETGEVEYVQLKATDNQAYIDEHFDKYPDIPLIQTSGEELENLTEDVEDTIDYLADDYDDSPRSKIPTLSMISSAIAVAPIIMAWRRNEITKEQCIKMVVKTTGMKAAKVAALLLLLSTSVAPVISAFLIVRVFSVPFKIIDEMIKENKFKM